MAAKPSKFIPSGPAPASTAVDHSGAKEKGVVALEAVYGAPNFKWQMVFNSFAIEKQPAGTLLRAAYVRNNTAAEIVSIIISREGLQQLSESAEGYLKDFGNVEPFKDPALPAVREFTPLFSNHVRLARSGGFGECSFYTVPLKEIAHAARAGANAKQVVNVVQVALLHSDVMVHRQLVLALLASL